MCPLGSRMKRGNEWTPKSCKPPLIARLTHHFTVCLHLSSPVTFRSTEHKLSEVMLVFVGVSLYHAACQQVLAVRPLHSDLHVRSVSKRSSTYQAQAVSNMWHKIGTARALTEAKSFCGCCDAGESESEPGSYVWAPKGLRVFQIDDSELAQGGDVHAIKHGNVSVTPLYAHFEEHR